MIVATRFRLYDLRHTFATKRVGLMRSEELKALMRHKALMSHTNIQTTLRYQKVKSRRSEEVAKQAPKVLSNKLTLSF
jgi:integrase/recombinase XerD